MSPKPHAVSHAVSLPTSTPEWAEWERRQVELLDRVIGSAEALSLADDDVRGGFAEVIAEYVCNELDAIEFTVSGRVEAGDSGEIFNSCQRIGRIMKALAGENKPSPVYNEYDPWLKTPAASREARTDPTKPLGACCNNEQRGMNGGCGNCGGCCRVSVRANLGRR